MNCVLCDKFTNELQENDHSWLFSYNSFVNLHDDKTVSRTTTQPCYIQWDSTVFTSRVANNVDPYQLASQKLAGKDLHCFRNRISSGLVWEGLLLIFMWVSNVIYVSPKVYVKIG